MLQIQAMRDNSNNGGLSLTTAPPHPCHRTPICGTHVHCQGISGRLDEDAGVARRVDRDLSASWSCRTLGRRDVEGLAEMLQLDLEGRPRLLQHRHRHRRLRGHSFSRLAVRVGKQRGHH